MIIVMFINGLRSLNFSLDIQYATDRTRKVEMRQSTTAMINVFSIHLGNALGTP